MTTQATSLLGLALPITGELDGTWGDTVNDSITSLVDTAIAGTTTLSVDADVTLDEVIGKLTAELTLAYARACGDSNKLTGADAVEHLGQGLPGVGNARGGIE